MGLLDFFLGKKCPVPEIPGFENAQKGDLDAQFALGHSLILGLRGPLNVAGGMKWIMRAALRGHPKSQAIVGVACAVGGGVVAHTQESCAWLILAREKLPPRHQLEIQDYLDSIIRDQSEEEKKQSQRLLEELRRKVDPKITESDIERVISGMIFQEPDQGNPSHECLVDIFETLAGKPLPKPLPAIEKLEEPPKTLICTNFRLKALQRCQTLSEFYNVTAETIFKGVKAKQGTIFEYLSKEGLLKQQIQFSDGHFNREEIAKPVILSQSENSLLTRFTQLSFVSDLSVSVFSFEDIQKSPELSSLCKTATFPLPLLLAPIKNNSQVFGIIHIQELEAGVDCLESKKALGEIAEIAGQTLGRILASMIPA
jgi:hypothetical protein